MSTVNKLDDRIWKDMPSIFWIVPPPRGHVMQSIPAVFAHQKSAEEFAKKQSQINDCYYRVYRLTLHGTAIPQDSQFAEET